MLTGLVHLHNVLRWVILILLLISLVQALTKKDGLQKTSLWLLIAAHSTLVLGLFLYFNSAVWFKLISEFGFGEVMKSAAYRFWAVEHISAMLIAIILITIARGKAKRVNYKAAAVLYVIALLLILAAVPWPFREGIARPWFPGM